MQSVLENKNKYLFILVAVFLGWIKTYITYKTAFDINIDNQLQEFILFINPISSLLIIFGITMFIKEKRQYQYIILVSFLLSILLYCNIVFYRYYSDFLTLPVMFQTSNFSQLDVSVMAEMYWTDIFYFTDSIILTTFLFIVSKKKLTRFSLPSAFAKKEKRIYYLIAVAIIFFNLGLAKSENPDLFSNTFAREDLVKSVGPYNYSLFDVLLQSKLSAQKVLADSNDLVEVENYLRTNQISGINDLFGIAKGKNVIVISLESTQEFVINAKVDGQEITPFLNEFIKESYYFNNFYHQTGQGKTSDSEFIVDNSLYSLGRGAIFFTHPENEYRALPEILNDSGYFTSTLHANNKLFWNRENMYQALGYKRFYNIDDYTLTNENTVGWGLKDVSFFQQSIEHIKNMDTPYYAKLITLTNHHPFLLGEEDTSIEVSDSYGDIVGDYFKTVRYQDEAVKSFIEQLKAEGLYEDSIIIMYGDHYGLSSSYYEGLEVYLEKDIGPYEHIELQKVPFIIHIPGQEGQIISTVGGQIDIKPTILNLLGIDNSKDLFLGHDLFSQQDSTSNQMVVFRNGDFVSGRYVYTEDTCYEKGTGKPVNNNSCVPYIEKANYELNLSDQIIYGDLLRFDQ